MESRKQEEWCWDAETCCDEESFQASPLMKAIESFGQNDERQEWYMGLDLDMERATRVSLLPYDCTQNIGPIHPYPPTLCVAWIFEQVYVHQNADKTKSLS